MAKKNGKFWVGVEVRDPEALGKMRYFDESDLYSLVTRSNDNCTNDNRRGLRRLIDNVNSGKFRVGWQSGFVSGTNLAGPVDFLWTKFGGKKNDFFVKAYRTGKSRTGTKMYTCVRYELVNGEVIAIYNSEARALKRRDPNKGDVVTPGGYLRRPQTPPRQLVSSCFNALAQVPVRLPVLSDQLGTGNYQIGIVTDVDRDSVGVLAHYNDARLLKLKNQTARQLFGDRGGEYSDLRETAPFRGAMQVGSDSGLPLVETVTPMLKEAVIAFNYLQFNSTFDEPGADDPLVSVRFTLGAEEIVATYDLALNFVNTEPSRDTTLEGIKVKHHVSLMVRAKLPNA